MIQSKQCEVAGLSFTAREMTVGEITDWVERRLNPHFEGDGASVAARFLPVGELVLEDLFVLTDLTFEDVKDLGYQDLAEILNQCRELDPHFFSMASMVTKAAKTASSMIADAAKSPGPGEPKSELGP